MDCRLLGAVVLTGSLLLAGCESFVETPANSSWISSAETLRPRTAAPTANASTPFISPTDRPATSVPLLVPGAETVPVCGSDVPPLPKSSATSTPAPDTCTFPTGGSASPACPSEPTIVVTADETRAPLSADRLSGSPIAGFGRFGGREGGSMCFSEYPAGVVLLTNEVQAVLLVPSDVPLRLAGRPQLARSEALWGAVDTTVDHVELQDSARLNGVPVKLIQVGLLARVFVAPVAVGSATITAFGSDDKVQVVRQG